MKWDGAHQLIGKWLWRVIEKLLDVRKIEKGLVKKFVKDGKKTTNKVNLRQQNPFSIELLISSIDNNART